MQLKKFKKILLSMPVTGRETIVAQSYKIPLNAFQLFGFSRSSIQSRYIYFRI